MLILRVFLLGALRDRISLFWALVVPVGVLAVIGRLTDDLGRRLDLLGGMLVMSILFFAATGTAFVVLGQRTRGVYKLLRATPYPTSAFIAQLAGARAVVAGVLAAALAAGGVVLLELDIAAADVALAMVALAPTLLASTLLGFTLGNLANDESQAAMLTNAVTLPLLGASSAFYQLDHAPSWLASVARALPLEHAIVATRGALAGDGAAVLAEAPVLAITLAVAFALAVATFRWDPHAPALAWRR